MSGWIQATMQQNTIVALLLSYLPQPDPVLDHQKKVTFVLAICNVQLTTIFFLGFPNLA